MNQPPLVIGNWKMELSFKGSLQLAAALKKSLQDVKPTVDVVLCPSFPSLPGVHELFAKSTTVQVGAQAVHWEEVGAWTGAVGVTQISSLVDWCIVGHSEQRVLAGISEEHIQRQVTILLAHGIAPIVCLGESRLQHERDVTTAKVTSQVRSLLQKLTRTSLTKLVIAYEPIWAIGTNATPDPDEVASVMLLMRKLVAERFGNEAAERLRIVYGGSVKANNVASFVSQPGVNGVLVGSASVHPGEFVNIVKAVQAAHG